jgi:hypothetical protein
MTRHSQVPVPQLVDDKRLRIHFATRDADDRARAAFIEVDADHPGTLLHVGDRPSLDLGKPGTFDHDGVAPTCLVEAEGDLYMYYQGFVRQANVPYFTAIGVAASTDGGVTFTRLREGPVVDRTPDEPYAIASSYVLLENGTWRLWYTSITGWLEDHGRYDPVYEIKYAESDDGIRWKRDDRTSISHAPHEAISRPWVVQDDGMYRMWYSHRRRSGFRTDRRGSYRIGYAESEDGISWIRRDEQAGMDPAHDGWDSEMVEFPALYERDGATHLLYNGNGFGESGIGHAVLRSSDPGASA